MPDVNDTKSGVIRAERYEDIPSEPLLMPINWEGVVMMAWDWESNSDWSLDEEADTEILPMIWRGKKIADMPDDTKGNVAEESNGDLLLDEEANDAWESDGLSTWDSDRMLALIW